MRKKLIFLLKSCRLITICSILLTTLILFGVNEGICQVIPRVPVCPEDPLHPVAGKPYTYAVKVSSPYGAPQSWDWYVTNNPKFISGSALVTTGIMPNNKEYFEAGPGYHDPGTGTSAITINWSCKAVSASRASPFYLVVRYEGTSGTDCEAMNLKAYRIEPRNTFTLDLTNMNGSRDLGLSGANQAVTGSVCAADVLAVGFDGTHMLYDYGQNELVFKVVAANFSGGWKPSVKLSGLAVRQSVGSVEWSETTSFQGTNPFIRTNDTWISGNTIPGPADNNTGSGKIAYIRVIIQNKDFEGLTDTPVTLAINGVTDGGDEDVHYADCQPDGFANDVATQVILARPVMASSTGNPVRNFLP